MKALVTGGSGFIGSHVVDKLLAKGVDVRIYDMVYPTYHKNTPNVEFFHASLLDFEALRMAMSGIDVIFHLAAIADVKDVFRDPHYSESINVRGTANVLEAARGSERIKRVVYASTIWVYSDCKEPKVNEETTLPAPTHLYSATKLAGEHYCHSYSKLYGLETTIVRYGIPYGPRARGAAVLPIFVRKAFNNEPITIAGDGSQFRKFVYVEDLAEGNVLALKSVAKNKIYNLEGKEKVTIRQIADTIKKVMGKDIKIEHTEARPGDFAGAEISAELAKEELGWEPKTSFEEGVRRYINWYKEELSANEKNLKKLDTSLKGAL